ncbi:MAG: DPP IV N-terminal domain-containing protein [Chloroflexota bacterium]
MIRFFLRISVLVFTLVFTLMLVWHSLAPHLRTQMIAYVSNNPGADVSWTIRVLDMRTGSRQTLPAAELAPATFDWAPTCDRMVLVATADGRAGVYEFDWQTFTTRMLIQSGEGRAYVYPRWSPDGENILLIRATARIGASSKRDLILYEISTGNERVLLEDLTGGVFPTWAPGGKKFVYQRSGLMPDLYEVELETGVQTQLTSGPGAELSPAYSPDGKHIAYSRELRGRSNIYLLELATGNVEMLSRDYNNAISPTWSPDGKQVAFARGSGSWVNNIFIADLVHDTETQITFHREWTLFPQWSPCGGVPRLP